MKLAIIGTAGRDRFPGPDWEWATQECKKQVLLAKQYGFDTLVSGGAAWADALAVSFYLDGLMPFLEVYLPAQTGRAFDTMRYYHNKQLYAGCGNPFRDLVAAEREGARLEWLETSHGLQDFKIRNQKVADRADAVIALTYGEGNGVRDGGTMDTVQKFLKRGVRPHVGHIDLSTHEVYSANPLRMRR